MSLFTIYHVVGIKVGCTKEYDTRCMQNRMTYGADVEIVILEIFDGDDNGATLREQHWAKQLGYRPGNAYANAIAARRAMGKNGAQSPRHPSQRSDLLAIWQRAGADAARVVSKMQVACPHCGTVGAVCIMKRWHFDRCKRKPLTEQIPLT